jgi:putative DNA primase/helicase
MDGTASGGAAAADAIEIARLAALPPLEYDRQLKQAGKRMGVRVSVLDAEVRKARQESGADAGDGKQGRALSLPDAVPWPEPVDGAALLDRLAGFFTRHVFLPPRAPDAMAAWAVHSHCPALSRHTPRLAFTSPEKRCGKTTALDAVGLVVARPLPTANVTAAAIFRTIEAAGPTLLIDEADTFLHDNDDLRGILNAGHKRGGQVIRCVGDDAEPRAFAVYGPAAIACIGRLPGTIEDRSLMIPMKRATRAERPEPLRPAAEAEGAALARRCARWVADHAEDLRDAEPPLPAQMFNRVADCWRPLFAIAVAAGGDWPERLARAADALAPKDAGEGRGVRLLADVHAIFCAREVDRLASAELCSALADVDGAPWADCMHGRQITQNKLASLLKPFGISSGTVRFDKDDTARGYLKSDFAEAWNRYLDAPAPPAGGSEVTHRHNPPATAVFRPPQGDTALDHVSEQNPPKPASEAGCVSVSLPNPRPADEEPFDDAVTL